MQEKRTPVFQNEDGSWGHVTQTVNPLICTIEYSYNTGFPSKKEAEESYQKSQDAYSNQIQQLKKSRKIPFTFSEYLDYWFREVYSPYSTSKSTLFKYRWVLYQIILPHLQNDVLLDCVSEEFLNKLLDSCQGYCQNGGYYAYKLLNIILWSAYQNNYIPEKEFPTLKHYSDPQHKSVFLSTEQIRKLLDQASTTSSYLEILLALFCGLSTGEILGLKYSDLNSKEHTLTIQRLCTDNRAHLDTPTFKNLFGTAQNRTLKIPDFIFQELSKRKKENRLILEANPDTTEFQDYVCLGATARIKSTATPGSTLRSITKNALLPALNMTDLRHMSAYILAEMGVDIESISHILGHTKLSSTIASCCNFPDENNEIQSVLSNTLDPVLGIRNSLGKEVSHAQGKEH